ncbi:hypothetical protein [Streptomyces fungicidicus]|uniref:Uncharacterized protein n=1 Tax=Streptomyces fungicidicus TaxID=68203 RepID=A0A494UTL2_9ACTN|nr:hypothetical protein [Streptomyces fungicidicus]AYL36767.1 hypothetical protein CNQ36_15840 [Streptomyces fungicidicus]
MPGYDSSRSRLRLADRHVRVIARLAAGETPDPELFPSLGELQELGLVGEEGELSPLLRELVGALKTPVLNISVEITGEAGPVHHGVLVGAETVIAHEGWPGDEESEYIPIEPSTLVFELARMVRLRRGGEEQPAARRVESTMKALDGAFAVLAAPAGEAGDAGDAGEDRDTVRKAVTEAGTTGDMADALTELVLALNSYWRVTVAWDGQHDGGHAPMFRSLAVWDCGSRGYWIREQPEEPILPGQVTPDSPLHLVRSDAGEIWRGLTALIPEKEELGPR